MSYAIDTDGAARVGSTLVTSGVETRDCTTTLAYAAGLARRGIATDHPLLPQSLHDFTATHLALLDGFAAAWSALGRDLTWEAQSAHDIEVAVAADLGAAAAAPPVDSYGLSV